MDRRDFFEAQLDDGAWRNCFFDTAGDPMPEELDMLLKITSLDKIVFGTDYPNVPTQVVL